MGRGPLAGARWDRERRCPLVQRLGRDREEDAARVPGRPVGRRRGGDVVQDLDFDRAEGPPKGAIGAAPRLAMVTFVVLFCIHLLDYLDRNILTSLHGLT